MKEYKSFDDWWKDEGREMIYEDYTAIEVAQRAWLVAQSIEIKKNIEEVSK